jgi:sarcosine oxidase subunit alpha
VATNNDRAYSVARALRHAGARVTIADTRVRAEIAADDFDVRRGVGVAGVHGAQGVEAVSVGGASVEADCLLVSGGFTPTAHLYAQAQGKLRYDERLACFVPGQPVNGMIVVGAANGTFDLAAALAEGHAAGGGAGEAPRAAGALETYAIEPAWPKPGAPGRQWIDFQNDVTLKDVELAARENFRSVEHLKRYTTLGMATDQGKTSNLNGLAAMAALTGRTIGETGTTTYRPPFAPIPFAILAGRRRGELHNPVRRLALEPQHRAAQASFREYGGWLRPAYFGQGDAQAAIQREAKVARESVGLLDASPLGKIEVFGPQAGALMDFNFYNVISTLKSSRIRYAFMLTESGIVYDDGVVAKLADDHYIVSCSSGHVQGVTMRLEEWRQDRFDPAQVTIHNATSQWATLTASGPRARALVEALDLGIDCGDATLPHMSFASCAFEGRPARIARVSFTGDRSYEISVPSANAPALFAKMSALAGTLGGCLMGSEALLLLRAEKGYLIAGKDTDGTTIPGDLGLSGPRDKRRDEYVGKRSLFTENALREDRPQFIGLSVEGGEPLPTGAHGLAREGAVKRSIGFVTSSYFSPTLGKPIALGLIERGLSRIGAQIELVHFDATFRATISNACALDPEGARLHV